MNEITKNQEKRFCVYAEVDLNGEVFFIADGLSVKKKTFPIKIRGRSQAWHNRAKDGYTVQVLKDNLTRQEANELCIKMIEEYTNKGISLVNIKTRTISRSLTKDMFEKYVEIAPDSKYGLVWKVCGKGIWAGKDAGNKAERTGYILISLNKKTYYVHRVIYALAYGECPSDMQINHKDGNKQNNRLENLELVTASENVKHSLETGLRIPKKGEESAQAILTEKAVLQMYDMFMQGMSNEAIADVVGIEWKHVSLLRNGKRWKHLYEKYGKKFPKSAKPMKIQDDQILQALRMFEEGYNNLQISQATGIERSQVSRLRHGKTLQSRVEFLKSQQEKQPDLLAA